MPIQLKDLVKINPIIQAIERGKFDANDVDNLLGKLRPYGRGKAIFLEVAHYVAHPDDRNEGMSHFSITAFSDFMRFFMEFITPKKVLDFNMPQPIYLHRLFLAQARLSDEVTLKARYKMSRETLMGKIRNSFTIDKKAGTFFVKKGPLGIQLIDAIRFTLTRLDATGAFHIRDFHSELKTVMREQKLTFDEAAWDRQADRVSLAILCLISNTDFTLPDGGRASCALNSTSHFRLLNGQRQLANGEMSEEPKTFGSLGIRGEVTVIHTSGRPLETGFSLIQTDLNPAEHCHKSLFVKGNAAVGFDTAEHFVEMLNLERDMALSPDFKLVTADSLFPR